MDILIAPAILLGACLLAVVGGRRLMLGRLAPLWALVTLLLTLTELFVVGDRLALATWVPWSGLIFLALALPVPLMLFFLVLLWPRLGGTRAARGRLAAPLVLLTLWLALGSFFGAPPETQTQLPDSEGVVHQTSESSCSAASAATLLAAAKISATETELAALCLTRTTGTPMLGVYRALRLKTEGTSWRTRVLSRASLRELQEATKQAPVLLSVGLDRWQRGYDPRYVTEWGWTPGKRHAVVVFGFLPDGKLDMGDPSVGREKWSVESLNVLWNGEGIQIVMESK